MTTLVPLDMLGRVINPGDHIAYALTAGRSANLAIYRVEEIVKATDWYGKPSLKLRATKLKESYGYRQQSGRAVTLAMAEDRSLIIPKPDLPDETALA